jgi:hypothetical protein
MEAKKSPKCVYFQVLTYFKPRNRQESKYELRFATLSWGEIRFSNALPAAKVFFFQFIRLDDGNYVQ